MKTEMATKLDTKQCPHENIFNLIVLFVFSSFILFKVSFISSVYSNNFIYLKPFLIPNWIFRETQSFQTKKLTVNTQETKQESLRTKRKTEKKELIQTSGNISVYIYNNMRIRGAKKVKMREKKFETKFNCTFLLITFAFPFQTNNNNAF